MGWAELAGGLVASGTVSTPDGTNTSGAVAGNSVPAFTNTAVGIQVNATEDTMVYLTVTVVFVGLVIKIGRTSATNITVYASNAAPVGSLITVRVPAGYFMSTAYTSGTFATAIAVPC
jgi:hypothetical protein